MLRRSLIVVALFTVGCAGSPSGATPTPSLTPTPTAPPAAYTVSGMVTATNGGQALNGLSVTLNGLATTTNGAGIFSYTMTSGTTSRLTLDGGGIVPRSLTLNVGSARTAAIGAIALGSGFDLNFYRALVRNGFEAPNALQPLRRWTQNPNIFLRTVDDAGTMLDAKTLDLTESVIRDAVPLWTDGRFSANVERGVGTKDGALGWITIHWQSSHNLTFENTAFCGNASVGANPGTVNLVYAGLCRCPGVEIRPRTVRHELGHAMGFWHTGDAGDLMSGLGVSECDRFPSGRERTHAAIAYARPVGNTDPDNDPTGLVNLAPMVVR